MFMTKSALLLISIMGLLSPLCKAQSNAVASDPSGAITKFNPAYKGLGPEVYFLPAARSLEEVLRDEYQAKKPFSAAITKELAFNSFIYDQEEVLSKQITLRSEDTDSTLNSALMLLKKREFEAAHSLLEEAATGLAHAPTLLTIKQVIADLNYFQEDYKNAEQGYNEVINLAVQQKNRLAQAHAMVQQALILAHLQQFIPAQQLIIRQAIPLYNKEKAYAEKISAWGKLAAIYRMDRKYTEAQWFLLQARALAQTKDLSEELAEIEYMLALTKYQDQSFQVAQREFLSAYKLAEQEGNKLLILAIHDKLGEVQLQLKEFQAAELSLKHYNTLKKSLFN